MAEPKLLELPLLKIYFSLENKPHHGEEMNRVVQYDQFGLRQNSIYAAVQVCGSAYFLQLT